MIILDREKAIQLALGKEQSICETDNFMREEPIPVTEEAKQEYAEKLEAYKVTVSERQQEIFALSEELDKIRKETRQADELANLLRMLGSFAMSDEERSRFEREKGARRKEFSEELERINKADIKSYEPVYTETTPILGSLEKTMKELTDIHSEKIREHQEELSKLNITRPRDPVFAANIVKAIAKVQNSIAKENELYLIKKNALKFRIGYMQNQLRKFTPERRDKINEALELEQMLTREITNLQSPIPEPPRPGVKLVPDKKIQCWYRDQYTEFFGKELERAQSAENDFLSAMKTKYGDEKVISDGEKRYLTMLNDRTRRVIDFITRNQDYVFTSTPNVPRTLIP
jgi:hypothetical protein